MRLTVLSVAYPLAPVSDSTAGGAEQILLTLDRTLVEHGHHSVILAAAGSRCEGLLVPVQVPSGNLDASAKRSARQRFREVLDRTLRQYDIDVIHMHGIDFNDYLPDNDVPIVVTLHLPLSWYSREALNAAPSNVWLVCVSRSQAQTAPQGMRVAVIPNGVDLDRFRPSNRMGDYLLYMGRICPEKALHLAIEAAESVNAKLLIAGSVFDYPEHREYFEKQIRPRLNGNAVFLGAVGGRRKAQLLAGAKCILIPTQAPETSSLIAMEALASGTPVIAWRSGALTEIVSHGRTGFLVSSVDEMISAMTQISRLRRADCRAEAEQRFSSERMISDYFNFYRKLTRSAELRELQAA